MPTEHTDVLVVGGGIVGAMTAWRAARRGAAVAVVEAGAVGHRHGSSHGSGRILRVTGDTPAQVRAHRRGLAGWHALEADAGRRLVSPRESAEHLPPAQRQLVVAALTAAGEPAEVLSPAAAQRRWPHIGACWPVLCQPDGASIVADDGWHAAAQASRRRGAAWHEHTEVERLDVSDDAVTAAGGGRRWQAPRAVIAAGAATRDLAATAGVRLSATTVHHVTTSVHATAANHPPADAWPVLRHRAPLDAGGQHGVYGLPVAGGVRVGSVRVNRPPTGPDDRPALLVEASAHIRRWLPGLEPTGQPEPPCHVIEVDGGAALYHAGRLAVALGCDGGWFKLAPDLGERLAAWALDDAPAAPLPASYS